MGILDKFKETLSAETTPEETVSTEDARITGKIIKVASDKGWGFISSKDIPFERIFFHWSGLLQNTLRFPELKTGMKVEYTPVTVPEKGLRATKIIVVVD